MIKKKQQEVELKLMFSFYVLFFDKEQQFTNEYLFLYVYSEHKCHRILFIMLTCVSVLKFL